MKIKDFLKNCTINSPNVFIYIIIDGDIDLYKVDNLSILINNYGNSDVIHWSINYSDGDINVFFRVKG